MKKTITKIYILLIFVFSVSNSYAAIKNRIIVKVGNETVTSYELKNKINMLLINSQKEINQENINSVKKFALNSLINLKLKKIELSNKNIEDNELKLKERLNNISSGNILEFKKKFQLNNISYSLFEEELKINLRWQTLIYTLYNNKVKINEKDINEQLAKIKNQKSQSKEVRLQEIELLLDDNVSDKKEIENILNQIYKIGFEKFAEQIKISGNKEGITDLGWINENALSENVLKNVKKMQIGEISSPIKNANTVTFFKLIDRRSSRSNNVDIAKIRNNLINSKKNEIFNLYSNSHLSKIKNNTLIVFKWKKK